MSGLHRIPRLFADVPLVDGASITLDKAQSHYVTKVMRLKTGSDLRLFNGRDGEWLCSIAQTGGKSCLVDCREQIAEPQALPDIDYLFAPLKAARLDYLVQKATEMGARRIRPVITEYTVVRKVNDERLVANVREAAEQCNMVSVPEVLPAISLGGLIDGWEPARRIVFCDEAGSGDCALEVLGQLAAGPLAVLIGPEGGFSPAERDLLLGLDFVVPVSLGPRIMRADTAGVAALALVQSVLGDWR
jgi:16S rRNA (uracil1498-N3)-methyltransferase